MHINDYNFLYQIEHSSKNLLFNYITERDTYDMELLWRLQFVPKTVSRSRSQSFDSNENKINCTVVKVNAVLSKTDR